MAITYHAVKWSIRLSSNSLTAPSSTYHTAIRDRLTSLLASSSSISLLDPNAKITSERSAQGQHDHLLHPLLTASSSSPSPSPSSADPSLQSTAVAKMEVFDVALLDADSEPRRTATTRPAASVHSAPSPSTAVRSEPRSTFRLGRRPVSR